MTPTDDRLRRRSADPSLDDPTTAMNVLERLRAAFAAATPEGGDPAAFAAAVRPSTDPKFGDYQANGCMALAKALRKNPRELGAGRRRGGRPRPAGRPARGRRARVPQRPAPRRLDRRGRSATCSVDDRARARPPPAQPKTVVIDYSSPNVAKPMHVGHIRSTVIGESLARIFAALGHKVIRDNHLGDWGSQFGMILWGWKNAPRRGRLRRRPGRRAGPALPAGPGPRSRPASTAVEDAARAETAKLHAGDPENRALWERFMPHCLAALQAVYDRLGVTFDVELGESFYDPMLADVVEDLEAKGLAVESEGATVVFVEGSKAPFIVRKSDGAFNYATTDLATIQYRVETWNPDQVLYVVDHRQGDHFKQLFAVARRWGYDAVDLEHVAFGTILGPGPQAVQDPRRRRRRPRVAARRGGRRGPQGRRREQPRPRRRGAAAQVAEVVGLGAIKYADLSQNRLSDYVFDWQKMLAMNGNTGDLPPVRLRPDPEHLPQGGRHARGDPRAAAGDRPEPPRRAGPRRPAPPAARDAGAGRRRAEAEHPDRLPVRPGQHLQHVLRGMPGAQGRVARAPRQPPGPLRPDGPDLEIRARPAWNRRRRPDVTPTCRPAASTRPTDRPGPIADLARSDVHDEPRPDPPPLA